MKNFIFITDFLPSEITGGAELTFEAIKQAAPEGVVVSYLKSEHTPPYIWQKPDTHFILGNYTRLTQETISALCAAAQNGKVDYSIVEFDYKYCICRNEKVHNYQIFKSGQFGFCNCANSQLGAITKIMFSNAKKVHFMSQAQMDLILSKMPELNVNKHNMRVQWSTWTSEDLARIEELRFIHTSKANNGKFAIQSSQNWLKGMEAAIEYAKEHNLDYDIIEPMEYHKFLETITQYKGFIFLPNAYDTCPRVIVEAFIIGLEIVLNDNVQIKQEIIGNYPAEILDNMHMCARNFWKSYQL